ncbi:MAG: class I SAM-dependent methyltransferase [Chloroflexota bacterium]|nr:class I SAM-dependent methyltransferase [Chloroflexota bacterium]
MDDATRHDWIRKAQETWDARAASWNTRSGENALAADREEDLDRIWTGLALHSGARLLDAGCGSGQFALALAARGARVTGIDLSPEMIRLARENAEPLVLPDKVTWEVGAVDHLPLPTVSVDAIHARMVLPFVPDVPAALREFRRVLRPDGHLLASTAAPLSPIYRESWRRHLQGETGCNYLLPWELERLALAGGWTVCAGWGEWGDDARGRANATASGAEGDLFLRQATATTWTMIFR